METRFTHPFTMGRACAFVFVQTCPVVTPWSVLKMLCDVQQSYKMFWKSILLEDSEDPTSGNKSLLCTVYLLS